MTSRPAELDDGDRLGRARDGTGRRTVAATRSAVFRFTAGAAIAVLVLVVATVLLAEQIARHRALQEAREQAAGIAARLAAPLVDADVRAGVPGAADQLDTVMANRMNDGSISHVKLWDADGRIIWSDEDHLVGRHFALSDDVRALFGTRRSVAELSDLGEAENTGVSGSAELLEVYAGAVDADGTPIVFEAYLASDAMEADARAMVASFVPLVVGALVAMLLVVLPLAISLTRRVERAQRDRSLMARHALRASDEERRRVAEELHDGVVQDLAGLGYALPTVTQGLRSGTDPGSACDVLDRATALLQRDVVQLRSLMSDIYPPDLRGQGLHDALRLLAQSATREAGVRAELRLAPGVELEASAARLTYRIVREALRNVVKHAGADTVVIDVSSGAGQVSVRVADDGVGPGEDPGQSIEGHLGLRMIRDAMDDFGGRLQVLAPETGGTTIVARFPARLVAV